MIAVVVDLLLRNQVCSSGVTPSVSAQSPHCRDVHTPVKSPVRSPLEEPFPYTYRWAYYIGETSIKYVAQSSDHTTIVEESLVLDDVRGDPAPLTSISSNSGTDGGQRSL